MSASSTLIHLDVLSGTALGALEGTSLANVKVAPATSSVNSTATPQSKATAAILQAAVAGEPFLSLPSNAIEQTAAPDNPTPTEFDVVALDAGLLQTGIGHLSAHARWNEATANPTGPVEVTDSSARVASVTALPGDDLGLALPLPGLGDSVLTTTAGTSTTETQLVSVPGQTTLGAQAVAKSSTLDLTLFKGSAQEVRVEVLSPQTLTGTATGTDASSVTYTSSLVRITPAGQEPIVLDSPDEVFEIPLTGLAALPTAGVTKTAPKSATKEGTVPTVPAPAVPDAKGVLCGLVPCADAPGGAGADGDALLRLSLGHLEKSVTPTAVSGEAYSLRLEVLSIAGTAKVLDLTVGELKVSATVPAGGIPVEGNPTATPPNGGGDGDGELPVTGTSLTLLLAGGVGMLVLGRFAMVWARRFQ
ncbi:MAG TPA: hypothetical protein VGR21_05540 [Cryptosporangiaceae bacterium]|nr:hypothetical protein [Cryptosporangiaceae bacterium]